MGQEILYCCRCQTRIVGSDFDKGVAFRAGEQTACAKCAMEMLPTLPLPVQEQILAQKRKAVDAKEKKPSPSPTRPTGSSTQMRSPAGESAPSRLPMTLLIGVGVAL